MIEFIANAIVAVLKIVWLLIPPIFIWYVIKNRNGEPIPKMITIVLIVSMIYAIALMELFT